MPFSGEEKISHALLPTSNSPWLRPLLFPCPPPCSSPSRSHIYARSPSLTDPLSTTRASSAPTPAPGSSKLHRRAFARRRPLRPPPPPPPTAKAWPPPPPLRDLSSLPPPPSARCLQAARLPRRACVSPRSRRQQDSVRQRRLGNAARKALRRHSLPGYLSRRLKARPR
jgi:hypothetical protein